MEGAGDDTSVLRLVQAVQAVPSAGRVVAVGVADAVVEDQGAPAVEVGVALELFVRAVAAVKEALLGVALGVAAAVVEDVPAVVSGSGGDVAHLPWVDAQPTVAAVVVAEVGVALFVTPVVTSLIGATVPLALGDLFVHVNHLVSAKKWDMVNSFLLGSPKMDLSTSQ